MKQFENEEAVSPVIGVILMVAITVILAAVIAAFVFGMAGNVQTTKSVAATATAKVNDSTPADKDIFVTYQGGADDSYVTGLNYTLNSGTPAAFPSTIPGATAKVWVDDGAGEKQHIVVTAAFNDGSSQVILDTYV
ncbi:type IV pilin [Methanofollis fontis]|uniref:Type IV pilin n=1 Tax=Methanofollis fontis TaxID=2052832 RepID=A0A483CPT5_9EURY|nr:type IV pilin N-terminal domain-containing protein [Methanofollis fontis]TAJ45020.1 type IV pilin [Methanofollis fontis]